MSTSSHSADSATRKATIPHIHHGLTRLRAIVSDHLNAARNAKNSEKRDENLAMAVNTIHDAFALIRIQENWRELRSWEISFNFRLWKAKGMQDKPKEANEALVLGRHLLNCLNSEREAEEKERKVKEMETRANISAINDSGVAPQSKRTRKAKVMSTTHRVTKRTRNRRG